MNAHTKIDWPPNYVAIYMKRAKMLKLMRSSATAKIGALEYYRTRPAEFICDWLDTVDPRKAGTDTPARVPFVLFQRQREFVQFIYELIEAQEGGLAEKCRDFGATWSGVGISVHLWIFWPGAAIGWGSRKQELVDRLGDMDSIFEKIRSAIEGLPREFWPKGFEPKNHMSFMKVINPETGASITGESGDDIGRGGRKLMYFKDEAQPLDAGILTPFGWKTMADVTIGSFVIGANGKPCTITQIKDFPPHDIYRVTFSDGTSTECSPNHLWTVQKIFGKHETLVMRSHEIAEKFRYSAPSGQILYRYRAPICDPVEFTEGEDLPLNPYLVGALLGDGSVGQLPKNGATITTVDDEIRDAFIRLLPKGCTLSFDGDMAYRLIDMRGRMGNKPAMRSRARQAVIACGIAGMRSSDKCIPDRYKFASIDNRIALLQGLMDTDGSASSNAITFHTTSRKLANDTRFLVQSLGGTATLNIKPDHRGYKDNYVLNLCFNNGIMPFRLKRKIDRVNQSAKYRGRTIVDISIVGRKPVRCVSVDAHDGLYLTDHCIVTHNSAHYQRPERIEAALADNTNVQVDISSVNGTGNVFHRRRMAGTIWTPNTGIVKGRTNVFIMDWRDHPAKDNAWYETRRKKAEDDGLMHIFEQEVNRNYAASVEGIIIPAIWVRACFDAHKKIPGMEDGPWTAGFDPYDEGRDKHALIKAKGVVIKYAEDWTEGNTGDATRRVVIECRRHGNIDVNFDASGVGAGVKSEADRLSIVKEMPAGMRFIAWNGGAGVRDPEGRVDDDVFEEIETGIAPKNKEMFGNMKAQAWWSLRRRAEKTYRAIVNGETYPPDELMSIDTENIAADKLGELERQLSQPTRKKKTGTMKLIVDKSPEGSSSPNLGDGAVMALFPVNSGYIYDLAKSL